MDTAQPIAAAETDPVQNAADAFKSFGKPPERPRDDAGRFAAQEAEETEEAEYDDELEAGAEGEDKYEADEAEEDSVDLDDEEDAQPLPPSWPEDKAEVWKSLSADAKALIAERDAEQLRATNAKFQEIANARKAAEAEARSEANAKRAELIEALGQVEQLYTVAEPDPRAFGYGTQQFNQAAYQAAVAEYRQQSQALAQFKEQRETLQNEATEQEKAAFQEWKAQHEEQFAPKLLSDVPELKDPDKGTPLIRDLVKYAVDNGIPEDVFAPEAQDEITSAQLHLLWKAQQFDKARTKPAKAKPKPAGPAVKPGVSSPRSARNQARKQRDFDRLAREGSIEAGAAVFKHFL